MRLAPQIITGTFGDGVHDDTQVIEAALAQIAETTNAAGQKVPLPGLTGNTVLLPAGAYRITDTLKIPAGLTLAGVGWNRPGAVRPFNGLAGTWIITDAESQQSPVVIDKTTSRPEDDRALYQLKHGRALDLYRCDNPHLSNIFAYGYDR
ncbi:MAG: glycosyl hydrolase family 28-related protein [Acidimicrobiales bacterium]|jgi:hypothetical protein